MRFLLFIIGVPLGMFFVRYARLIPRTIGYMGWAEERFGPGGSENVWRFIGIAVIIGSFLYLFGQI